jgi:hypothetical protein
MIKVYAAKKYRDTSLCVGMLTLAFLIDEHSVYLSSQAMHGVETANYEFPLMTKDELLVELLLNATTRRDANQQIIGVVGIGCVYNQSRRCWHQVVLRMA